MKFRFSINLLIAVVFLMSCKKEPKDFRDKYTGNWDFLVVRIEHNTDSLYYYKHDTITYAGNISIGNSDSEIIILYTQENALTLIVNEAGELSNFPTEYCNGEFEGNSNIHLYIRWGGLGGSTTHIIDGTKND